MHATINRFRLACAIIMSLALVAPSVGQSAYTREDAKYVDRTPSYSVLDYIVCLAQSENVDTGVETLKCQQLAQLIPVTPRNPELGAIIQRIRDCGFWQRDATPELDCTEGNLMSAYAGSWGGKVRSGPGMNYAQLSLLHEGEPIALLSDTGVMMNGYPWFRISYRGTQVGYHWGGIICALDTPLEGVFEVCDAPVVFDSNSGNDENGLNAQNQLAFIDDQLNTTYQNQINSLDDAGVALLKEAQRAWISYRDKECARRAYLTQTDKITCLTNLTEQRTTELNAEFN